MRVAPRAIEVDLVVATDFEVLDAGTPGEEVVSDGENVVALEVGLMAFEEMEVVIEVLDEVELLGHEVDGPDATSGDGSGAVSDLVVDVGGGDHGLMTFDAGLILDAASDSPLACGELSADSGIHSKTSWRWMNEAVKYLDYPLKPGVFEFQRLKNAWDDAWLRTSAMSRSACPGPHARGPPAPPPPRRATPAAVPPARRSPWCTAPQADRATS